MIEPIATQLDRAPLVELAVGERQITVSYLLLMEVSERRGNLLAELIQSPSAVRIRQQIKNRKLSGVVGRLRC